MLLGTGAIVARAGYLGFVQRGDLSALANDQRVHTVPLPAQRGTIYDREGIELAADRPTARVEADPFVITDPFSTATALSPLLHRPVPEIAAKLTGDGRWAELDKRVDHSTARRIARLKLTGIHLVPTTTRVQIHGDATAQLLGLVDADGKGQGGIEGQYDARLHGVAGSRVEARDPRQDILKVLASKDPQPGQSIVTTIDARIQNRAQQIAADTATANKAKSATIVVTTVDGRVLAMASAPSYNPNDPTAYTPENALNRATALSYEPGSTFKVVSIAGALETGKVHPSTSIYVPTYLDVDKELHRTLKDAHERSAGMMSVADILRESSNVGTVLIARRYLRSEGVNRWIDRFGFGKPTGIGLSEETGTILPTEKWSGASIYNIPIGQGDTVTQMQLTRAYAAVANGGVMTTPRVVDRIGGVPVPPGESRRIMSPRTAAALTEMLRGVVSADGTGSEASIPNYEVAGKTGTANKIDPKTGEYSQTYYTASFVGFAPANNPQIVVSVVVDEPMGGVYSGGDVAAPAFEKIAQFCLTRLKIPPG